MIFFQKEAKRSKLVWDEWKKQKDDRAEWRHEFKWYFDAVKRKKAKEKAEKGRG